MPSHSRILPEGVTSSWTPSSSPQRIIEVGSRDARFLDEEQTLDDILERTPKRALPIEADLMKEVENTSLVPEGLVRVAFKAVAIAHSARQYFHLEDQPTPDATYKRIGTLINSSLQALEYYNSRYTLESEGANMTGVISEMSIYALAAYDASLSRPLTGRLEGARPRYVLPSTTGEDLGGIRQHGSKRAPKKTGVDFKVTYAEGEDPHRYVQVKTRARSHDKRAYDSRITVVGLNALLANHDTNPMRIPEAIAADALGAKTTKDDYRAINIASRRLNRMIK